MTHTDRNQEHSASDEGAARRDELFRQSLIHQVISVRATLDALVEQIALLRARVEGVDADTVRQEITGLEEGYLDLLERTTYGSPGYEGHLDEPYRRSR